MYEVSKQARMTGQVCIIVLPVVIIYIKKALSQLHYWEREVKNLFDYYE
jgi:hypothetical protein